VKLYFCFSMVLLSPVARWLLLVLLGVAFASHAEPITPLLRPAAVARLRAQLHLRLPDTTRARLLLRLANDQLGRHEELNAGLDSTAQYAQQAQALSTLAGFVPGQINSLYVLGRLGAYSPADTLGRALLRQGIALSQRWRLPLLQAYGWFYLAQAYPSTAYARKLVLYDRSQALFQQAGARLQVAYLLKTIADVHLVQGNIPLTIEQLQRVPRRRAPRAALHLRLTDSR
jgi:hypothetical protein